jgi:hypothetical protein
MTRSQLSQSKYDALVGKLNDEKRLHELRAPEYSEKVGHWTVAKLVVDLEQVYQEALGRKAKSIEVIADILHIPETFVHTLGSGIRLLSLVARSVKVEGNRAVVRLQYQKDSGFQPVIRLLADEIEGEFRIYPLGEIDKAKTLEAVAKDDVLRFISYSCNDKENDKELVRRKGKLPLNMLDSPSRPLYQLITASFDLAAGMMRQPVIAADEEKFVRSILTWLTRWASYPSPYLARLFEDAATLNRLLPFTNDASQTIHIVPQHPPEVSLNLARSQLEVTEKYELDKKFDDLHTDLHQVVGKIVNAWIKRDEADNRAVDEEIEKAKELVAAVKRAVETAAQEMDNQKFDAKIQGINLKTELEKDKIHQIVKAVFEILGALVEIGSAVAALGANPAAMGALSKTFKPFEQIADAPFSAKIVPVLMLMYGGPFFLFTEIWGMKHKDRDEVMKELKSAVPAVISLFEISRQLMEIAEPFTWLEKIGDLVGKVAAVPNAVEAKAIWDSFEVEVLNQLESIIVDKETSAAVRSAALEYKTQVQKFAIYGRMSSEQQAILAQRLRELGTLMIRKAATEQKRDALKGLQANLGEKDSTVETLNQLRNGRLDELRRAFFAALYRFRAAYFYKNLQLPAKMPVLVLPADAAEMRELLNDIAQAETASQTYGDFTVVKTINKSTDPEFFTNLQEHKEAKFHIDLGDTIFTNHHLVRLNRVHTWLVGAAKTPIELELLSGTEFQDRLSRKTVIFSGQPVSIGFKYEAETKNYDALLEGVCPTPFATWTLRLHTKELDLNAVEQIKIEMIGKAAIQR